MLLCQTRLLAFALSPVERVGRVLQRAKGPTKRSKLIPMFMKGHGIKLGHNMIEENTITKEELLLHDEDFPEDYVHMAHPDDYKEVPGFVPQFIMHEHFGRHNRLIVRAAWKTSKNTFIPMSFVCDTGAPSHVYLSNKALSILNSKGLLLKDERETPYINIHISNTKTFPATIEETPHVHKDANILGLKSLKRLNLHLMDNGFSLNEDFVYL